MARRMAGVGRVTVSLRRSTTPALAPGGRSSLAGSVTGCAAILCAPASSRPTSAQQFYKHFVRDSQALGPKADDRTGKFNQPGFIKRREPRLQWNAVHPLQVPEINAR